jgi:hypothetical protein
MATSVTVQLLSYGNESQRVPVLVEVFDSGLERRYSEWLVANARQNFPVDPGIWDVRARMASGGVLEKAVEVGGGMNVECPLPLHRLSPHETNEWAYFTQPINRSETRSFYEPPYRGAWIRFWSRGKGPLWRIEPDQKYYLSNTVSSNSDGVVIRFKTESHLEYAIQVGGPKIPWKFVGVPADSEVSVLVRPVAKQRTHPLEVLVASNNMDAAALLTLLRRGDVG